MEQLNYGGMYVRRSSPFVHTHRCEYVISNDRRKVCYRAASVSPSTPSHRKSSSSAERPLRHLEGLRCTSDSDDDYLVDYRSHQDSQHVSYDYGLYGYDDGYSPVNRETIARTGCKDGLPEVSPCYLLDKVEPQSFINILKSDFKRWRDGGTPETVVTKLHPTSSPASRVGGDAFDKVIDRQAGELKYIEPRCGLGEPESRTTLLDLPLHDLIEAETKASVRSPARSLFGPIRGLRRRMRERSQDSNVKRESSPITTHRVDSELRTRLRNRTSSLTRPRDEGIVDQRLQSRSVGTPIRDVEASVSELFKGVLPDSVTPKYNRCSRLKDGDDVPIIKIPKSILKKILPKGCDIDDNKPLVGATKNVQKDETMPTPIAKLTLSETVRNYVMPIETEETSRLFLQRYRQRRAYLPQHAVSNYPFKISSEDHTSGIKHVETFKTASPQLHANAPRISFSGIDTVAELQRPSLDLPSRSAFDKGFIDVTPANIMFTPGDLDDEDKVPSNIELSRLISTKCIKSTVDDFSRQMTSICSGVDGGLFDAEHSDATVDETQDTVPQTEKFNKFDGAGLLSPSMPSLKLMSRRTEGEQDMVIDPTVDSTDEILAFPSTISDKLRVPSMQYQLEEPSLELTPMRSMEEPMMVRQQSAVSQKYKSPSKDATSRFSMPSTESVALKIGSIQDPLGGQEAVMDKQFSSHRELERTIGGSTDFPILRVDTSTIEDPLEPRLKKTMSHKDLFHEEEPKLGVGTETPTLQQSLISSQRSIELGKIDVTPPSEMYQVSKHDSVLHKSSSTISYTKEVEERQVSMVVPMGHHPSVQLTIPAPSGSFSAHISGSQTDHMLESGPSMVKSPTKTSDHTPTTSGQILPSDTIPKVSSQRYASKQLSSGHEIMEKQEKHPLSMQKSASLTAQEMHGDTLMDTTMNKALQPDRLETGPASESLSKTLSYTGVHAENSIDKHMMSPSNQVWNEGVDEPPATLPMPTKGAIKQEAVGDIQYTEPTTEGATTLSKEPTVPLQAVPSEPSVSEDEQVVAHSEEQELPQEVPFAGHPTMPEDDTVITPLPEDDVKEVDDKTATRPPAPPKKKPSLVLPEDKVERADGKTEDAPAKKKKHKDGEKQKGEKKKHKKKKHKKEIDDDRPRPLRHLVDKQLKEGFKATVYIVTSKKNATSSMCTVKFDYDTDRLIFETPSNVFDIDASKVVAEEIPTLPGAPILLKLTVKGRKSSAVVIQSTFERNLNVLGGTVGWAKAAGQDTRSEDNTDFNDDFNSELGSSYVTPSKAAKEADGASGQRDSSGKDGRKRRDSNRSGRRSSKRDKDSPRPDTIPEDLSQNDNASLRESDKEAETNAGSSGQKRGLVSRLLLRKKISNSFKS